MPVGAFLSAGIDSSTVVALMQSLHKGKVKSFTIGMEEKDYNEAVYAKEIARYLGTDHTELYITEEDAKGVIPRLSGMFGEPFADSYLSGEPHDQRACDCIVKWRWRG